MTLGEREERKPLVHPHDGPARPLAGGSNVDETVWTVRQIEAPSSGLDSQGFKLRPAAQECASGADIAWLFHPHDVSIVRQDATHKVECGLCSGDDDNLARNAIDTPCH